MKGLKSNNQNNRNNKLHLENKLKILEQSLEAVVRRCSVKNVFLEFFQSSQENTCGRVSSLTKLQA